MRQVHFQRMATAASLAALLLAAAPQWALAGDTHPITDGAAKGQANEGTFHPSSGAMTGRRMHSHMRRKLPGKMKSGALTVAHGSATGPSSGPHSNTMMGNHKD